MTELRDALARTETTARTATVADLCAHLACNRLGVNVVEEAGLRYLAGRAVQELARERTPRVLA